jgi:hypothetical protein
MRVGCPAFSVTSLKTIRLDEGPNFCYNMRSHKNAAVLVYCTRTDRSYAAASLPQVEQMITENL